MLAYCSDLICTTRTKTTAWIPMQHASLAKNQIRLFMHFGTVSTMIYVLGAILHDTWEMHSSECCVVHAYISFPFVDFFADSIHSGGKLWQKKSKINQHPIAARFMRSSMSNSVDLAVEYGWVLGWVTSQLENRRCQGAAATPKWHMLDGILQKYRNRTHSISKWIEVEFRLCFEIGNSQWQHQRAETVRPRCVGVLLLMGPFPRSVNYPRQKRKNKREMSFWWRFSLPPGNVGDVDSSLPSSSSSSWWSALTSTSSMMDSESVFPRKYPNGALWRNVYLWDSPINLTSG